MPSPTRWTATAWEGTDLVLYDLVKGFNGSNITQASLSALTAKVFDKANGEQIANTLQLSISSCIFDSLQSNSNDARYPTTGDGYNFRATIPGGYFPLGGTTYIVEAIFSDTSTPANNFVDQWEVTTKEVWSK